MPYESVQCPECGQVNEIAEGSTSFFCIKCGTESEIEYEYVYDPPNNTEKAPVTLSNEEAEKRLKRAYLFLEDGEWGRAWSYCESVLDYDPENARAYLAELLVALRLRSIEELDSCKVNLNQQGAFRKALRFADEDLRMQLEGYAVKSEVAAERRKTQEREEAKLLLARRAEAEREAKQLAIYERACGIMKKCQAGTLRADGDTATLWDAITLFESLGSFKDSEQRAAQCRKLRASFLDA